VVRTFTVGLAPENAFYTSDSRSAVMIAILGLVILVVAVIAVPGLSLLLAGARRTAAAAKHAMGSESRAARPLRSARIATTFSTSARPPAQQMAIAPPTLPPTHPAPRNDPGEIPAAEISLAAVMRARRRLPRAAAQR
jgi:hypothetical protein